MSQRLFLAVPVPESVHAALAQWTASWKRRDDGWRWVAPAGIHLTLRFYGATDAAQVPALAAQVGALARRHAPFEARALGWGVFPGPGRPRVLWAGLEAPAGLAALAQEAEADARALGYAPEERAFRAHLTLARAADRGRPVLPGAPDAAAPVFGAVPVRELVVYESHLGPGGARYAALLRAPLGSADA